MSIYFLTWPVPMVVIPWQNSLVIIFAKIVTIDFNLKVLNLESMEAVSVCI